MNNKKDELANCFKMNLNDLGNETDEFYIYSARLNLKRNYLISKTTSNLTRPNTHNINNQSNKFSSSSYKFYDIICKRCLELHSDQCELCDLNKKDLKSKPSETKSFQSESITTQIKELSNLNNYPKSNHSYKSYSCIRDNIDDINKSIYAVIFKEKSGSKLKESQIENLIHEDYIDVSNLSTPFEKELNKTNEQTENKFHFISNKSDFLTKRKKALMLIDLNQRAKFSKTKASKHFFKNLSDLQEKYRNENEIIKFNSISHYAMSSNNLINEIDIFDIHETYKIKKPISNEVSNLINKNRDTLEKIRIDEKNGKNNLPFLNFVSTKKFHQQLFNRDNKYKVNEDLALLKNLKINLNRNVIEIN